MDVSCECCVLSGRSLCEGSVTRPEELPGVSVIVKPQQWGSPSPIDAAMPGKITPTYWWSVAYFTGLLLFQIIHCSIEWDNCTLLKMKCLVGSIITVILFPNFPGRSGDNHRNFIQNIRFPDRNPNRDSLQCKSTAVPPDQVPRKIEEQNHKYFSVVEYREKFQLLSKCRRNACFLTL
jgi:hypothetical protein